MKRIAIIIAIIITAMTSAEAQNIRLGEKIPDISVVSELGSELKLGKKEHVCMIFVHSQSVPCVIALTEMEDIRDTLIENFDVVLITSEQSDIEAEIMERLNTKGMTIAYDNDRETFKSFGINYVPFAVIFDKRRCRVQWFGPIRHLDNESILRITK